MTRRFRPAPEEPADPPAVIDVPGEPEPITFGRPADPCPECGEDLVTNKRLETRRVPNPEGGRGSVTARIAVCGACNTPLGPA